MKTIRTDADVMRIANRIDDLSWQIQDLVDAITTSEHPNAEAMGTDLLDQCTFFAWANHVAHGYLVKPEQWDCPIHENGGHGRYYHKAGKAAAKTRRDAKFARRMAMLKAAGDA